MTAFEVWYRDNADGFEGCSGEVKERLQDAWNAAVAACQQRLKDQYRLNAAYTLIKVFTEKHLSTEGKET